jgi:phage/plasmid-associated DNA primase
MDPNLRDLLSDICNGPCNDSSYTHVTMIDQVSKWAIKPQFHSKFWMDYCSFVNLDEDGLCLAEKSQDIMPEIASLVFKFHSNDDDVDWEPYNDYFLHHICNIYQKVIEEFFNIINEDRIELIVVVLESSTHWYEEIEGQRYMLMEVRIQFPFVKIDPQIQTKVIRPRVIQLLRNNNVLGMMQRHPIGDWEQIISATAIYEPLLMYGSSKIPGAPKLKISHIWHCITDNIIEEGVIPEELSLEDTFHPENHCYVWQQTMNKELFEEREEIYFWLPMFLSIHYWPTIILPKNNERKTQDTQEDTQHIFGSKQKNVHESTEMELAERMLQLIDQSRYYKEALWTDIGKALYTAANGGENGLMSWIKHTSKIVGYNIPDFMKTNSTLDETCKYMYYMFDKSNISVKTLAWYAREDSPVKYNSWHKQWCISSMEKALSAYHTDVAEALYKVYWLDFVYCPVGRGKWYQFTRNRWFEMNLGLDLRKNISLDFLKRFEEIRFNLSKQIHDSDDESFRSNAETTLKKIAVLIGKLKTTPFKGSIMTEVSESFKQDSFTELLDTNPNLMGIANGILEASGEQIIFRTAKPEDYVSMVSKVPYHNSYTWNHPLVVECMDWMKKVFPDLQLLAHFLKFSASCIKGKNSDKVFSVFTGNGDNSKSMIVKLFEAVFGPYCIKFPISTISEKAMSSGGPSPQLARAKSTKVAFLDEGDDNVGLSGNTVKRMTGGDSFFARMLHANGGDIELTFKLILTCNNVPSFTNPDKAIKKRTKLFPFLSKFVPNPPETKEEQNAKRLFKMITGFEFRIPILAPAFLWIMTQYYPHYIREGLEDPAIIVETTEQYWKDTDVYTQFINDNIKEVTLNTGEKDTSHKVSLTEVYTEFKMWYKDGFPGCKVPERSTVRGELSSRWGRMQGNYWYGVCLVVSDASMDMTAQLGGGSKKPVPVRANLSEEGKLKTKIVSPTLNVISNAASPRLVVL